MPSTATATEPIDEHHPRHRKPDTETPVENLAASLRRLGQRRIWLASAGVFAAFAFVFFASSAPFAIPEVEAACGQQPPDMRFFTSADDVTGFLDACGPTGRDLYRNMQLADLAYPAVVGLFLASSLSATIGRLSPRGSKALLLALVPLVASLFDYIENAFAWFALLRFPGPAPTDALLGYASAAKTATSWASGVLLLGALAALGIRLAMRRFRGAPGTPHAPDPTRRRALTA